MSSFLGELSLGEERGAMELGDVQGESANSSGPAGLEAAVPPPVPPPPRPCPRGDRQLPAQSRAPTAEGEQELSRA